MANARPSREVLVEVVLLAPAVVLVVLVFLAGVSAETGLLGAVPLAVVSVAWLLINEPVEGLTHFVVAPEHGIIGSDLAGLTGLGLAVWRGTKPSGHRPTETGSRSRVSCSPGLLPLGAHQERNHGEQCMPHEHERSRIEVDGPTER